MGSGAAVMVVIFMATATAVTRTHTIFSHIVRDPQQPI
jgi:hypothetical protein